MFFSLQQQYWNTKPVTPFPKNLDMRIHGQNLFKFSYQGWFPYNFLLTNTEHMAYNNSELNRYTPVYPISGKEHRNNFGEEFDVLFFCLFEALSLYHNAKMIAREIAYNYKRFLRIFCNMEITIIRINRTLLQLCLLQKGNLFPF